MSLFLIFKLSIDAADTDQLDAFLNETILTLEVAITDTPRSSDASAKREKFEGTIVYTTNIPESSERVKERIEGQWFVAWKVTVPISIAPSNYADVDHGRTRISNPRVALTAILSLNPASIQEEPKDEFITADSWNFLAGQANLLASLEHDPSTTVAPILPHSRIVSSAPTQSTRTKPGRRICRHIFPCGSPLDIRMRYNPLEPDDNSISTEIVLLSVDLSVTPHAGADVLVKDVKVEMGGGKITPLQELQDTILKRYDVLTLLFRYERYGGEGGRKTVSTRATMVPLLSDSEESSPTITSLWNKILDIPNLSPSLSQFTAPTQRAASQIMSPSNSSRNSPKPSIAGKPRGISTAHGRTQTLNDYPLRPLSSTISTLEVPNISITVTVPSEGVAPNEEFTVDIQVVNRANRPIKLALHIDSGQSHFRSQHRVSRTEKVLPRVPVSASLVQPTEPARTTLTEIEAQEYFLREQETRKGKPIIALTVDGKIG